ncbi:MAG TPA: thiopurine S-methyltransferase [Turneriella sp.]|nr:thiopurine S-methyltransferase [Turneriella sp.]
MEKEFWYQRWQNNQIGFHLGTTNPLLVKFFKRLELHANARVFVPLCGKTRDIPWLLSRGFEVVGVELSPLAVEQFFEELGVKATRREDGPHFRYTSHQLTIFQGDIFDLTPKSLGRVDAVYDRAALVALPPPMRHRYTQHLIELTHKAPQLLLTFDYDQSKKEGPPFSVGEDLVRGEYGAVYTIELLHRKQLRDGLGGVSQAEECVWHLS